VLLAQYLGSTTGTLRGRVTDAITGKPIRWANVTIAGTGHSSVTDESGAYVIGGVPDGTYRVVAIFPGYETAERRGVRIATGKVARVDLVIGEALLAVEATAITRSSSRGTFNVDAPPSLPPARAGSETEVVEAPALVPHLEAEITESAFAANLVIPKPVDLETGAEPKRSLVVREKLPGRFVLEAVPRLSDHVFVKGTLTNSLDAPLLPGAVDVYVESIPAGGAAAVSNFVGQDRLDGVASGEELTMHFGVDQNVKVEQELVSKEVLSKRNSKRTKVRYRYAIVAESFRRDPVELWIVDRVPVSVMKDIRVQGLEMTPEPDEMAEDGLVTWKLMIEPGQRREISTEYVVVYPSEFSAGVLGLEE